MQMALLLVASSAGKRLLELLHMSLFAICAAHMQQRYRGRENTMRVEALLLPAEDGRIAAVRQSDSSASVRREHIDAQPLQRPDASLPCRDITRGEPWLTGKAPVATNTAWSDQHVFDFACFHHAPCFRI
jgi:hypothetical protein